MWDAKGKPNEVGTSENTKQVLKIVMDERKLNVCEIAEMVNISMEVHVRFYTKIRHEKCLFQMDALSAHNRTKATANPQFRELFATVYSQ